MRIILILKYALLLVCALQIAIFPSIANIVGCLSAVFSFYVYELFVLRVSVITQRPFSFIAISCLFLFMYLPPLATLIDGHPMIHNMQNPIKTFILQTLYYTITVAAFYVAGLWSKKSRIVSKAFYQIGFFSAVGDKMIWMLALAGLLPKVYLMMNQYGAETAKGAGTADMFSILSYLPICLLYKDLYGGKGKSNKWLIYIYIVILTVINIGTNSRSMVMALFLTWGLIHLIYWVKTHRSVNKKTSSKVLLVVGVSLLLAAGPLARLATAMVLVRAERGGVNAMELLSSSLKMYGDDKRYEAALQLFEAAERGNDLRGVDLEWSEAYVDNVFFQRLCNYRVIDNSIYYADQLGYGNESMVEEFETQLLIMFPQPIVNALFGYIDKSKHEFSPMDHLLSLTIYKTRGSYTVGGDVGLGLAVMGYLFFPVIFLLYILLFYLYDQLVLFRDKKTYIPTMGMIMIYSQIFLTLSVANGMLTTLSILLWVYWFRNIMFGIINGVAAQLSRIRFVSKDTE